MSSTGRRYACRKHISISISMTSGLGLYPQLGNTKIDLLWYESAPPTTVSDTHMDLDVIVLVERKKTKLDILYFKPLYSRRQNITNCVQCAIYVPTRLYLTDAFCSWKAKNAPPLPLRLV